MGDRYHIIVRNRKGKVVIRQQFKDYEQAMSELDRLERVMGDEFEIEYNDNGKGKVNTPPPRWEHLK